MVGTCLSITTGTFTTMSMYTKRGTSTDFRHALFILQPSHRACTAEQRSMLGWEERVIPEPRGPPLSGYLTEPRGSFAIPEETIENKVQVLGEQIGADTWC